MSTTAATSVVVWCACFHVPFGAADLGARGPRGSRRARHRAADGLNTVTQQGRGADELRAGIMTGMQARGEPGWSIRCDQLVELVTDYLEQIRETASSLGRVSLDGLSAGARARLLAAFGEMYS